jgi:hypothetical protein
MDQLFCFSLSCSTVVVGSYGISFVVDLYLVAR